MKKLIIILASIVLVSTEDYQIRFSHIPIGQGISIGDSTNVTNSIGGIVSKDIASDSFSIGAGFLQTTQNVFSDPPLISNFTFPDRVEKGNPTLSVSAEIYDLNGISKADLYLQKGGSKETIILAMSNATNYTYSSTVHDSLIGLRNLRAKIISEDNLGFTTSTEFIFTEIEFNNSELSMGNEFSNYPGGIEKNEWSLVSWPSRPVDTKLAQSDLSEGHIFYDWDPIKESYVTPSNIEMGKAYWFKHKYKDPVIVQEDSSVAIALNNFTIALEKGWNLIGSPFSFPVNYVKGDMVSDPITYSTAENIEGWTGSQSQLIPWNGYAIYSAERDTISLIPFEEEGIQSERLTTPNEWILSIKLKGETFFNHSSTLGRRGNAVDEKDNYDIPIYPNIASSASILMDLNGTDLFNYISDVRGVEDFNGVWNLRLDGLKRKEKVNIIGQFKGALNNNLFVGLVDISERMIYYDFLESELDINPDIETPYDLKLVAGDIDYVKRTSEDILSNIPEFFVLGQNYPNPFNPTTRMVYELPKRSKVIIAVYNLVGQEVKLLVNDERDYGRYTLVWDGTDNLGRPAASGLYFTRMITNDFNSTTKMLLLK